MTKNRVRFVVEIDSRLLPPFNEGEGLHEIANSTGFGKALTIPSRMLQATCYPNFMQGYDRAQFDADRKEWGSSLVRGTAEHNNLLAMLRQTALVSFKVYPCFKDAVTVRANFRRNREELGFLDMTFNRGGIYAGGGSSF